MRYLKNLLGTLLVSSLVACGGGGGSPGGSGGSVVASKVAVVELGSSAATLDSASPTGVTLTAVFKDKDNNVLSGETFAFSASSGVLQAAATTSDSAGKGAATLTAGADKSNRSITVTISAGTVSQKLVIPVVGTTLAVNGSTSILVGGSTTYSFLLKDSAGVAVSGAPVTVTSSLGNTLSAANLTTTVAGSASVTYVAAKGGTDVLTVSSAGVTVQYTVFVSTVDFAFSSPAVNASVAVNTPTPVSVRLLAGGVGVPGQTINFSSTRGTVADASVVTDASGVATTTVTSPTAGPATVTAQVASGGQSSVVVNFIAVSPSTIFLQANVNAVAPNAAGSTTNRVALSAVVKDAFGNPVKGRTVNFSLISDTSAGSIENGTGTTDANGLVTASFIPGAVSTASNGVVISATVAGTSPVLTSQATLTVSSQALFITFQYSNVISNLTETTYSNPLSISVVDANGAPVANQVVALSVYPTAYGKGVLAFNGKVWDYTSNYIFCRNEDVNRDGILQAGEDTNQNGLLTPGLPVIVAPPTVTTDASGQAKFALNYGEQYAPWLDLEITARAFVAGTESRAVTPFFAGGVASDFSSATVPPAGVVSPFGSGPLVVVRDVNGNVTSTYYNPSCTSPN